MRVLLFVILPTRETQGEICLRVVLFVVLLGTTYERDARRDLFESAPACHPPRHCLQERRKERFVRECYCLSSSSALPTRETQGEVCLRVVLFVVLLGTAHKSDARRDLFESVPVWRPPRHCPRDRSRELSCLSFSSAPPTRETQGAILFVISSTPPTREGS